MREKRERRRKGKAITYVKQSRSVVSFFLSVMHIYSLSSFAASVDRYLVGSPARVFRSLFVCKRVTTNVFRHVSRRIDSCVVLFNVWAAFIPRESPITLFPNGNVSRYPPLCVTRPHSSLYSTSSSSLFPALHYLSLSLSLSFFSLFFPSLPSFPFIFFPHEVEKLESIIREYCVQWHFFSLSIPPNTSKHTLYLPSFSLKKKRWIVDTSFRFVSLSGSLAIQTFMRDQNYSGLKFILSFQIMETFYTQNSNNFYNSTDYFWLHKLFGCFLKRQIHYNRELLLFYGWCQICQH